MGGQGPVEGEEEVLVLIRVGSYSGFICALQMDRDCLAALACLVLLAHWSSWCYTGGQHSLLRPASSRTP